MYSFGFPQMLRSTTSVLLEDKEAVRSNLLLILSSEQLSHFGDPLFGCRLKQAIFEQQHSLIIDLLIDEIYTTIITFIPQVYLTRKDIELTSDGTDIFATVNYTFVLDNTSDLYTINLTNSAE